MTENSNFGRIEWVDISKGMAILLMVLGHSSIPEPLGKFIWSFHMPLFFIVSGFLYNPDRYPDFRALLKRRVKTLLVPYVFFSLIVCFGYFGTEYWDPIQLVKGWIGIALWFVPVLFMASVAYWFIASKPRWALVLTTVTGVALSTLLHHLGTMLPFKLEVVPLALAFICIGGLLRPYVFSWNPGWALAIAGLAFTFVSAMFLPKLDMCVNYAGAPCAGVLLAVVGSMSVFALSKHIASFRIIAAPLAWCGRNTIFFMAFSQLVNYWLLTMINSLGIPSAVGMPLRYILLLASIFGLAELLGRSVPSLVGKH